MGVSLPLSSMPLPRQEGSFQSAVKQTSEKIAAQKPLTSKEVAPDSAETKAARTANDRLMAMTIMANAMERYDTADGKALLKNFLEDKKSDLLEVRRGVLNKFPEAVLGKEIWTIGLVSMTYDPKNADRALISAIFKELQTGLFEPEDTFLASSILKAIIDKGQLIDEPVSQQLLAQLAQLETTTDSQHPLFRLIQLAQAKLQNPQVNPLAAAQTLPAQTNTRMTQVNQKSLFWNIFAQTFIEEKIDYEFNPLLYLATAELATLETEGEARYAKKWLSALLIHPSAEIPQNIEGHEAVVLLNEQGHSALYFSDLFQRLFEQGFETLCVLLPDSNFWPTAHYAKHAAAKWGQRVKLVDTHTYGPGLKLISEQAFESLKKTNSLQEVFQTLKHSLPQLRHWLIPQLKTVDNQFWFQRLLRQAKNTKTLTASMSPLCAFHRPMELLSIESNFTSATGLLKALLEDHLVDKGHKQALITHSDHQESAEYLKQWLLGISPSIRCDIAEASPFLTQEFGAHLSICLL